MQISDEDGDKREISGRLWRFASCEFDESSRQLRVSGLAVELESKPLDVLSQLLLHAGEVVTKEELLEAVWPDTAVVDGSLATAVSKLRKALADDDQSIVVTLPRVGYRLGVPVQSRRVAAPPDNTLGFHAGDPVPGRDQWLLSRNLDTSQSSEVWLAEHPKTREQRVFKFAADGLRLRGLKREVTISRFLNQALGDRQDFIRVLEWNFDAPPFYLESEFGGNNLLDWAASAGGLPEIPLAERLSVFVNVCRAVAAAHDVGVLHKDLKPANILISSSGQVRVADFGSGALSQATVLDELGITKLGFTTDQGDANPITGTILYMAPEILRGQSPSALGDVYALGVILYQLLAADFRKPLAAGWESDVADPLLRQDVADAASGDPARRLRTAPELIKRIETLADRRAASDVLAAANSRALAAEKRLAQTRARRPWVIAATVALAAGLGASLWLYRNAARERDRANQQTQIATSVNHFLANDLLGRGNPFQSGKAQESLAEAIQSATPDIDRRFSAAPEVAAMLHGAVARALDARTDYASARKEYQRVLEILPPESAAAVIAQLQLAAMEARTYGEGSLAKAKAILAEQEGRIAKLADPPADLSVWHASARGMIALIGNDAKSASEQFQIAFEKSAAVPHFDETARLTFQQRLAFALIRSGEGPRAEKLFRELIAAFTRLRGPDNPQVLRVRLNLAQAYMIQNKHREAVAETTAIYPAYVERLGEDHELAMQVLTTRAQSEGALGLWDDAVRDDLKIHQLAVKKQGPRSFFAIATLSDAALAQCRGGHLTDGAFNARKAYNESAAAFGVQAGLTGGTAYTLASCLSRQEQTGEALRLLQAIDIQAVAQLAGDRDWGANVDLALSELAIKRGDLSTARKHLDAASPAFSRPGAEEYQKKALASLRSALGN